MRASNRGRLAGLLALLMLASAASFTVGAPTAAAAGPTIPDGFRDELLWDGLTRPSAIAFAPDGSVFVAEKSGRLLRFDDLTDDTPTLFANLVTNVHNAWDRGMLGLAVDPEFPTRPYVYVLYTYDHILGSAAAAPRWGTAGVEADTCPNPPGYTADGCVVSGRLSRLTASGGVMTGSEHVLIEDWCQQFPSHSVGTVAFGPEGALYVSAGEGASFALGPDYGQLGGTLPVGGPYPTPPNPCGDPPGSVGGAMTVPTAEGGALRSQDIRTRDPADPVGLSGTIIRIDPDTGVAWPGNANAADASTNARRIIAYGLRNPFRFTFDAGGRLWVGDVGAGSWEEINLLSDASAAPRNFGWPCREGLNATATYQGLDLCTSLDVSATTAPHITWSHSAEVVPGDGCDGPGGTSSSISGLAFQAASSPFPAPYDGALFATDYSRNCIWAYPLGGDGRPDGAQGQLFANLRRTDDNQGGSVQLQISPQGDLIYVDYDRGEIRRIRYYGPSVPPTASFTATPTFGSLPLQVAFDASESSDPNPEPLTYQWDLDGDGAYDDGNGVTINRTYTTAGAVQVGLRVTDTMGLFGTATQLIHPGETPPTLQVSAPSASLTWKVGDSISFGATASDAQDGTLAAAAFNWTFEMLHCPGGDCHSHVIHELAGTRSGSFIAPDHEYPSHLRVTVTVTDSGGLSTSVSRELQPDVGTLSVVSSPAGIPLTLGSATGAPPPSVTGIAGSPTSVNAADSATFGEDLYTFDRWSDGGAQSHDAPLPVGAATLTATYRIASTTDVPDSCSASAAATSPTGKWVNGRFGKAGDVDWYRFKLSSTSRVRIVLGDLAVGARVELYRGCTSKVTGVDAGGTKPEVLHRTLPAGSYAVKVIGKSQASPQKYAFMVWRLPKAVTILSSKSLIEGSTLRLVGEVYNNTADTRHVTVTARLYNATGKLLATRTAVTLPSKVESNGRSPYLIAGSLPAGFAKATLTVTSSVSARRLTRPVVTITSSGPNSSGHWEVRGTVRNTSTQSVDLLRVGVILYNNRAGTLDAIRATTGRTSLGPGMTTSFVATAIPIGQAPAVIGVRALAYR